MPFILRPGTHPMPCNITWASPLPKGVEAGDAKRLAEPRAAKEVNPVPKVDMSVTIHLYS
jgi:hypothetical protein